MAELALVLKGAIWSLIFIIGLCILIPLSFYAYKKRHSSNLYRHLEFTGLFSLLVWAFWGAIQKLPEDWRVGFYAGYFVIFISAHFWLWANPVKEKRQRSKRND